MNEKLGKNISKDSLTGGEHTPSLGKESRGSKMSSMSEWIHMKIMEYKLDRIRRKQERKDNKKGNKTKGEETQYDNKRVKEREFEKEYERKTLRKEAGDETVGRQVVPAKSHLSILLWHHFRFYCHHWVQLILIIFIPFPVFGLTYYIVDVAPSASTATTSCAPLVRPQPSSGPFSILLNEGLNKKYRKCNDRIRSQSAIESLLNNQTVYVSPGAAKNGTNTNSSVIIKATTTTPHNSADTTKSPLSNSTKPVPTPADKNLTGKGTIKGIIDKLDNTTANPTAAPNKFKYVTENRLINHPPHDKNGTNPAALKINSLKSFAANIKSYPGKRLLSNLEPTCSICPILPKIEKMETKKLNVKNQKEVAESGKKQSLENQTMVNAKFLMGTTNASIICVLLRYKLAFFPTNSAFVNQTMLIVQDRLRQYADFFNRTIDPIPAAAAGAGDDDSFMFVGNQLRELHRRYSDCRPDWPGGNIFGFRNRKEFNRFVNHSTRRINNTNTLGEFWGGIYFDRFEKGKMEYTLIGDVSDTDGEASWQDDRLVWLQDVVDDAIYRYAVRNYRMSLSNKTWYQNGGMMASNMLMIGSNCQNMINKDTYDMILFMTTFTAMINFALPNINLITQLVTEKQLKLREYLYITGVGSFTLKLSWILFYLMFLIPLSALFTAFMYALPKNPFRRTEVYVIGLTFLLYNAAMVSFCFMMAALFSTPKRVPVVVVFILLCNWIISVVLLVDDIDQKRVIPARVLSCLPVAPLVIAFKYIFQWEAMYLGATSNVLAEVPSVNEVHGGIFECWMWLIGDTLLYALLVWYFEHVFPGDFGVKHPPWFPLMPSYYSRLCRPTHYDVDEVSRSDSEDPCPQLKRRHDEAAIQLTKLTKYYCGTTLALDEVSISFGRNEITSFLGQNGAGKTTTMNILVGLTSPTSGFALVLGKDVRKDMTTIRLKLGYVPQYNILYPSMTVKEHLLFFGWLKGLEESSIMKYCEPMMEKMGMKHLMRSMTASLSGGQKRKLSLVTVYMGQPEVIILDEPTAGVDPFSRRAMWELILSRRRSAATLISTHMMDEADLLADHVAVIDNGCVRAYGTPMHLKKRFGKGLRIIVAMDPNQLQRRRKRMKSIKNFFTANIKSCQLTELKENDLTFSIPLAFGRSWQMIEFLRLLDAKLDELTILSYGMTEPSMEEVFFAVAIRSMSKLEDSDEVLAASKATTVQAPLQTKGKMEEPGKLLVELKCHEIKYENQTCCNLAITQFIAMIHKKVLLILFTPIVYLLQFLIPLLFAGLMVMSFNLRLSNGKVRASIWLDYRTSLLFVQGESNLTNENMPADSIVAALVTQGTPPRCSKKCPESTTKKLPFLLVDPEETDFLSTCPQYKKCLGGEVVDMYCTSKDAVDALQSERTPSGDVVYRLGMKTNILGWAIHVNQSFRNPVGGFQFGLVSETEWQNGIQYRGLQNFFTSDESKKIPLQYVNIYYTEGNDFGMHNVWSNLRLRMNLGVNMTKMKNKKTQVQILTNVERKKLVKQTSPNILQPDDNSGFIKNIFAGMFSACAFGFSTFGIVALMQIEGNQGLKRMQMLFGCMPIVYWSASFVFDYLLYIITAALITIFLVCFENPYRDILVPVNRLYIFLFSTAVLVVLYGLMAISFAYLLSFVFKDLSNVIKLTVITHVIFLFAATMCSIMELIFVAFCDSNKQACDFEFALYICFALRVIPTWFIIDSMVFLAAANVMNDGFGAYQKDIKHALWNFEYLGKRILTAGLMSVLYFGMVVVLEHFDLRMSTFCRDSCEEKIQGRPRKTADDPDVLAENDNADGKDIAVGIDPMVVRRLNVTYPGCWFSSVSDVSFRLPKSACFGLIGLNGAGKTSTFKVLTGFLEPTGGSVYLNGTDITSKRRMGWRPFQGVISYCPQEDILFEALTVYQHMQIFARIRGIPRRVRGKVINAMVKEVGLDDHARRSASILSGGNRRKLQFALALLNYNPVVFLDEPTTGMDPASRRRIWKCIRRAILHRGCSVLLTSHSMDECEALCDRLAIMSAGSFHCIGSIQYLKDKFGKKYVFQIKFRPRASNKRIEVKSFIENDFPESTMIEEQMNMIRFETTGEKDHELLSKLFGTLIKCREKYSGAVEDFFVSQVTLEHVFMTIARLQEEKDAAPAPNCYYEEEEAADDIPEESEASPQQSFSAHRHAIRCPVVSLSDETQSNRSEKTPPKPIQKTQSNPTVPIQQKTDAKADKQKMAHAVHKTLQKPVTKRVGSSDGKTTGESGGKITGEFGGKITGESGGKITGESGGKITGESGVKTTGESGGKITGESASNLG